MARRWKVHRLGIGVGASFNLPIADNQAFIDNSTISANNVTVDASMQDKSGDVIHIRSHRKPARVPEVRSSWEQVRLPGTVRIIRPSASLQKRGRDFGNR